MPKSTKLGEAGGKNKLYGLYAWRAHRALVFCRLEGEAPEGFLVMGNCSLKIIVSSEAPSGHRGALK